MDIPINKQTLGLLLIGLLLGGALGGAIGFIVGNDEHGNSDEYSAQQRQYDNQRDGETKDDKGGASNSNQKGQPEAVGAPQTGETPGGGDNALKQENKLQASTTGTVSR